MMNNEIMTLHAAIQRLKMLAGKNRDNMLLDYLEKELKEMLCSL
jgi:hypothetical protein